MEKLLFFLDTCGGHFYFSEIGSAFPSSAICIGSGVTIRPQGPALEISLASWESLLPCLSVIRGNKKGLCTYHIQVVYLVWAIGVGLRNLFLQGGGLTASFRWCHTFSLSVHFGGSLWVMWVPSGTWYSSVWDFGWMPDSYNGLNGVIVFYVSLVPSYSFMVFGTVTYSSLEMLGMVWHTFEFYSSMVPRNEGKKYQIQDHSILHRMATRVKSKEYPNWSILVIGWAFSMNQLWSVCSVLGYINLGNKVINHMTFMEEKEIVNEMTSKIMQRKK